MKKVFSSLLMKPNFILLTTVSSSGTVSFSPTLFNKNTPQHADKVQLMLKECLISSLRVSTVFCTRNPAAPSL